ncbi:hypothetical protein ACFOY4_41785 [Actinomadura syzygii]|nr:hypothetical protein [Actinomadura syzygii]
MPPYAEQNEQHTRARPAAQQVGAVLRHEAPLTTGTGILRSQ